MEMRMLEGFIFFSSQRVVYVCCTVPTKTHYSHSSDDLTLVSFSSTVSLPLKKMLPIPALEMAPPRVVCSSCSLVNTLFLAKVASPSKFYSLLYSARDMCVGGNETHMNTMCSSYSSLCALCFVLQAGYGRCPGTQQDRVQAQRGESNREQKNRTSRRYGKVNQDAKRCHQGKAAVRRLQVNHQPQGKLCSTPNFVD